MDFDKSGGYRWLDSFIMASIVQLATIRFCEKFLNRRNDPCGRQYDQMTQAARCSGKENIIEGSERTATSKETEMRLTDSRTVNMLNHQLQALGDRFEKTGGFREQLTTVRTAERAKQDDAPACPDCGKPMHKRKARTGKNAGQEFWGCTGYPECRAVRQV